MPYQRSLGRKCRRVNSFSSTIDINFNFKEIDPFDWSSTLTFSPASWLPNVGTKEQRTEITFSLLPNPYLFTTSQYIGLLVLGCIKYPKIYSLERKVSNMPLKRFLIWLRLRHIHKQNWINALLILCITKPITTIRLIYVLT